MYLTWHKQADYYGMGWDFAAPLHENNPSITYVLTVYSGVVEMRNHLKFSPPLMLTGSQIPGGEVGHGVPEFQRRAQSG